MNLAQQCAWIDSGRMYYDLTPELVAAREQTVFLTNGNALFSAATTTSELPFSRNYRMPSKNAHPTGVSAYKHTSACLTNTHLAAHAHVYEGRPRYGSRVKFTDLMYVCGH